MELYPEPDEVLKRVAELAQRKEPAIPPVAGQEGYEQYRADVTDLYNLATGVEKEVGLADYAAINLGYRIAAEQSSAQVVVLESTDSTRPGTLLIGADKKGQQYFYSPESNAGGAGIIELTMYRQNASHWEACQEAAFSFNQVPPGQEHNPEPGKGSPQDLAAHYFQAHPIQDLSLLREQGVTSETLSGAAFKGRVNSLQVADPDTGKVYTAIAYPASTPEGHTGILVQQADKLDGRPATQDGLWASNVDPKQRITAIEIVVSPTEAMNRHQLLGRDPNDCSTLYLATGGPPSPAQIQLIQGVINKQEPGVTITLATDNTLLGARTRTQLAGQLYEPGMKGERPEWTNEGGLETVPFNRNGAYEMRLQDHSVYSKKDATVTVRSHFQNPEQSGERLEAMNQKVKELNSSFVEKFVDKYSARTDYVSEYGATSHITCPNNPKSLDKVTQVIVELRQVRGLEIERPINQSWQQDVAAKVNYSVEKQNLPEFIKKREAELSKFTQEKAAEMKKSTNVVENYMKKDQNKGKGPGLER